MKPEARQRAIEAYLRDVELASLEELAERVEASTSTIRRDLDALEARGVLQRTHGGARLVAPKSDEHNFLYRGARQTAEKEAIAIACAEWIQPNSSVICDAGTTVYAASQQLRAKSPQIVTNSLPIANDYASDNQVEVVVSGGVIYPRLGVLVGPLAVEAFSNIHVDYAIMSAGGLTEDGLSNSHTLLIDIQRQMLRAAETVIMLLDHSKFGRKSLTPLCDLKQVDIVITDSATPKSWIQTLTSSGVEVHVAREERATRQSAASA